MGASLASLDTIINIKQLRDRMRTGVGECMSRLALITHSSNEFIAGDYDRIYFHHVRKTAGTSIVHAFYSLSGSDPRSIEQSLRWFAFTRRGGMGFVQNDAKLIRQGRYFFATSHLPNYIAHPPADGMFSFTALRDPVNRVVSLYRYLRSSHSDNGFVFGALDEERMWAKGSFGKFLDVLPRETLLNQLYMFSPSGSI